MTWSVYTADCLEFMRSLPDASVDCVVTDPPYGLSFMGKRWDYDVPSVDVWRECLRVMKPGAHLLSFGGSRTYHRMTCNVEDAGFEIRDQIMYLYGSGFPKSHNFGCKCNTGRVISVPHAQAESTPQRDVRSVRNSDVSEAVDTCQGRGEVLQPCMSQSGAPTSSGSSECEADVRPGQSGVEGWGNVPASSGELRVGALCAVSAADASDGTEGRICHGTPSGSGDDTWSSVAQVGVCAPPQSQPAGQSTRKPVSVRKQPRSQAIRAPRKPAADMGRCDKCGGMIGWDGWGTALKPAHEPIVLARRPLVGTVASNVAEYGCGALNIDGCRVGTETVTINTWDDGAKPFGGGAGHAYTGRQVTGRWPANLIHDGSDEVVAGFPVTGVSAGGRSGHTAAYSGGFKQEHYGDQRPGFGDAGSASRYFYCAKASKADRDAGCDGLESRQVSYMNTHGGNADKGETWHPIDDKTGKERDRFQAKSRNHHPTVKPTDLMRYLCRLVTPPGGTVLDPFTGSGSTGRGAILEGFNFIGIERDAEYADIARRRCREAEEKVALLAGASSDK